MTLCHWRTVYWTYVHAHFMHASLCTDVRSGQACGLLYHSVALLASTVRMVDFFRFNFRFCLIGRDDAVVRDAYFRIALQIRGVSFKVLPALTWCFCPARRVSRLSWQFCTRLVSAKFCRCPSRSRQPRNNSLLFVCQVSSSSHFWKRRCWHLCSTSFYCA